MPLRPDEIENREFASSLRGFDKHEVRAFLQRVASDVDELEARLAEEAARGDADHPREFEAVSPVQLDEDRFAALGDRIASLLRQAHEAAAETRQQSEERAFQLRSSAEDELEAARVQAGRVREEAEASATAIRSQADEEAGRLRAEAEQLKAEADRLHAEAVSVRNEAQEHADRLRSEADSIRGEAEEHSNRVRAEAEEHSDRVRAEAEEHSDRVRAEADEHADRLRAEADGLWAEAERVRGEAQRLHDEAQAARHEADEYAGRLRGEAESEAVAIRDRAELEGAARLDDRRTEIEQAEERIEAERQAALLEVADARDQVATLLEEARAQSEFIKREAEEIIRAKVRNNIDQAQRRIDLLRNTETSSRNRILTAQRELEAALSRLDAETTPELGNRTEEEVLLEAEQRAIEADYPPFRADRTDEATEPGDGGDDQNAQDQVAEGEVIEGHLVEASETSYRPSTEGHGEAPHHDEGDVEHAEGDAGTEQPPENEDALARLVREAMQRAVEGARNDNR